MTVDSQPGSHFSAGLVFPPCAFNTGREGNWLIWTPMKPDYKRMRVPVLAIYRRDPPFDEFAANFAPRNEQERAALRQQYAATREMVTRWQRDLLAGVPTARIVELPRANLYMFLSNEADVLREVRAFAATLTGR